MGATLLAATELVGFVDTLERHVVAQADEIAELKALVADLTERLGPSPPVTLVGSSAYPGSVAAFTELETMVGRLGAWRLFISKAAPGPGDVDRVAAAIDGGRRPFVSVAGGTDETAAIAAAREFVRLIGPLGGQGTITFGHEPTQKYADRDAYVRAKNAYYRVIREALTNWSPIDIFMLWDIEAGGDRHPDHWIADLDLLEGIGVDAYDQGKRRPADLLAPALELAERYDKPLYVTETSTVEKPDDPTYKPNWINEMAEFCAGEDRIPTWIWFHSKVGANAPTYGWYVNTSHEATEAFRSAVATNPT